MTDEIVEKSTISLQATANHWEEAIEAAGNLLVQAGKVTEAYVAATIHNVKTLGPYILIAPNIALPHARPEDGVKEAGIAIMTLKQPVEFEAGKPFQLIIFLAAVDQNLHLNMLRRISEIIIDEQVVAHILSTTNVDDVYKLFNQEAV